MHDDCFNRWIDDKDTEMQPSEGGQKMHPSEGGQKTHPSEGGQKNKKRKFYCCSFNSLKFKHPMRVMVC